VSYPILWYSNAPWAGTGYGMQTALFTPRLKARGFDMAIASNWGLQGAPIEWGGMTVMPGGGTAYSVDTILGHAFYHFGQRKGLLFSLFDSWVIPGAIWGQVPNAIWVPIDCDRLGKMDAAFLRSCQPNKPHAIAMSKHGQKALQRAGFDASYVPHAVDTTVFTPDGVSLREVFKIPEDAFVVGINAANKGVPSRKAFGQQFEAFGRFARNHKDVMLLIHSRAGGETAEDLNALLKACEVPASRVRWTHQYAYAAGILSPSYVASLYRSCNLVTNASMGEGFGLATIEAQACGVPVVVTKTAASPELLGAGWVVDGIKWWNDPHTAFWKVPDPKELLRAYESAYAVAGGSEALKATAVRKAAQYDIEKVMTKYMLPTLERIGKTLENDSKPLAA
jgi:glycosyltransferase involved in cell wall biosynthesis